MLLSFSSVSSLGFAEVVDRLESWKNTFQLVCDNCKTKAKHKPETNPLPSLANPERKRTLKLYSQTLLVVAGELPNNFVAQFKRKLC